MKFTAYCLQTNQHKFKAAFKCQIVFGRRTGESWCKAGPVGERESSQAGATIAFSQLVNLSHMLDTDGNCLFFRSSLSSFMLAWEVLVEPDWTFVCARKLTPLQ